MNAEQTRTGWLTDYLADLARAIEDRLRRASNYRYLCTAGRVPAAMVYPHVIGPDPVYSPHPDRQPARQAWEAAEATGPVTVVIAWPATIYVTVEVERGVDLAGAVEWDMRITKSEVLAKDEGDDDNPDGWVYEVRRDGSGLAPVSEGASFAAAALAFVADSQWPDPTLTA